jgi:nonspecific dipeptidase
MDGKNLPQSPELQKINEYIDSHKDLYIERLREVVAIKSVSQWPDHRQECIRMAEHTANEFKKLGAEVELADIGMQTLPDGSEIPLPPILLAQLGNDPAKNTVCLYGHLDVQPAEKKDGWSTEPFELTEVDGKLFGRGATDDKGPILSTLHALEAFKELGIPLPVNLKFVYESMEEATGDGLEDLLYERRNTFLKNVDFVCISDNYWLGSDKPCLTYGLRGISYFFVEITCAEKDLHSGVFGGTVHEAMTDLVHIMSKLIAPNGKILIPGIYDNVAPLTAKEQKSYKQIDFDIEEYKEDIGTTQLIFNQKEKVLMHRWRYPSLSIHGVFGAFDGDGAKTVIPRQVVGKFSLRLVPNMTVKAVEEKVCSYIKQLTEEMGTPNEVKVWLDNGGEPWVADPNHVHYQAGRNAIKSIYGMEPDLTREGCSIPVTLMFQEFTGKNVMLLPIGACDDGAHSQNEKVNITNYLEGTKLLASYFIEVSKIKNLK